ncbi:hypothetical protein [Kineococcus sp. SYSU DK004]|uniref:hypothetical protein n=1 Tax=Kineococcus sp. SYSU DK004 TaxID=3383125 RepID=UPI003D7EBFE7
MAGGGWSAAYQRRYEEARRRGEPSPFADPPAPAAAPPAAAPVLERPGGRHCWVQGPPEDPGPFPGLLLAWRRDGTGWLGRVAYVLLDEEQRPVLVDTWVAAEHLRPTGGPRR